MTNRYGEYLLGLLDAILLDALAIYPTSRKGLERDRSRIRSLLCQRGPKVFTLDFPSLGKGLDRSLDEECLCLDGLPLSGRRSAKVQVPKLFSEIWIRIFDNNGELRKSPDENAILVLRQVLFFAKKWDIDCDKSNTYESVRTFYSVNSSHPDPNLDWAGDSFNADEAASLSFKDLFLDWQDPAFTVDSVVAAFEFCSDVVSTELGEFDPSEYDFRHGPGAVSDLKRGEYKYSFPSWPERLERVFPESEFAHANYDSWISSLDVHHDEVVDPHSKLIAVPKTQKTPRLIACEPTAHQWCQQSILRFLEDGLAKTPLSSSIHFRDQSYNQEKARVASHTGDHMTIDLSMASDSVQLRMVERVWRRNPSLLSAFYSTRTRWIDQAIDRKLPSRFPIRMFSTMGSAVTFHHQTYIYAIICIAAGMIKHGDRLSRSSMVKRAKQVSVFGDDLIIPSDWGSLAIGILSSLGFKVNVDKTFGKGRFRESCGVDAFGGYLVTPVYAKREPISGQPGSIDSCIQSSNRFHESGFWNAAEYIRKATGKWGKSSPIVAIDSGAVGFSSFVGSSVQHLKRRWNKDLQRYEVRATQVRTKVDKAPADGEPVLLQFFTERRTIQDWFNPVDWKSGAVRRPKFLVKLGWEPVSTFS